MTSQTHWKQALRDSITTLDGLLDFVNLTPEQVEVSPIAAKAFPCRVPKGFAAKIRPGDPNDPILKQLLPIKAEEQLSEGYVVDPLKEASANPAPGLLHKYRGRVLLVTTGSCAVHCRYCFRRHFDYEGNNPGRKGWQKVLANVAQDHSIREVILSGGDPLMLSDLAFADLLDQVEAIEHVQCLRIHSRIPVVLPERVTDIWLARVQRSRLQVVMVIHSNHANELEGQVADALSACRDAGMILLNQAVLLKGVNDNATALIALSRRLFEVAVLPYYLHMPDKVQGTAHFDVDQATATSLMEQCQASLPGYLVPRLVRELPNEKSKKSVW